MCFGLFFFSNNFSTGLFFVLGFFFSRGSAFFHKGVFFFKKVLFFLKKKGVVCFSKGLFLRKVFSF